MSGHDLSYCQIFLDSVLLFTCFLLVYFSHEIGMNTFCWFHILILCSQNPASSLKFMKTVIIPHNDHKCMKCSIPFILSAPGTLPWEYGKNSASISHAACIWCSSCFFVTAGQFRKHFWQTMLKYSLVSWSNSNLHLQIAFFLLNSKRQRENNRCMPP